MATVHAIDTVDRGDTMGTRGSDGAGSDDAVRDRPIRLSVTEGELAAFRVVAAKRGLSMSALALKLVQDAIAATTPAESSAKKPARRK